MIFLVLSILSSTSIAIIFKLIKSLEVKIFPVIVINYFSATILGLFLNNIDISFTSVISSSWIYVALVIGIFLIAGFYLIGYTTQKAGIAITTVSNKMSVILPMVFSILYYNESIGSIKIIGITLALLSVGLSVYKKRQVELDYKFIYLPILLFIVIGVIDSSIKLAQEDFVTENQIPAFTATSFCIAAILGVCFCLINKSSIKDFTNYKTLITGIILGAVNFGSFYFLIFALNHSNMESSIVYGVNNIAILSLSVVFAFSIFKEKLKFINWVGISLSIISVIILTIFVE